MPSALRHQATSNYDRQTRRNAAVHAVNRAWSKIPLDRKGQITADIPAAQIRLLAPWQQSRWKARRGHLVSIAENIQQLPDPDHRQMVIANEERKLSQDGTHIDKTGS